MQRTILNPDDLAPPSGFNHGILVEGGQLLFLAGQDASDATGEIVAPGDLVGQFERVIENLATVVRSAGGEPDDIAQLTIYVTDRDDYRAQLDPFGRIFASLFDEYPTMALFKVSDFFRPDAVIEMTGIAVVEP